MKLSTKDIPEFEAPRDKLRFPTPPPLASFMNEENYADLERRLARMKQMLKEARESTTPVTSVSTQLTDPGLASKTSTKPITNIPFFDELHNGVTTFGPPGLFDNSAQITRLASLGQINSAIKAKSEYDNFISKTENIFLFLMSCRYVTSPEQALLELVKYSKTFVSGSLTGIVEKIIKEDFSTLMKSFSMETQNGDDKGDADKVKGYIQVAKDFIENWKNCRNSELAGKFCNLVSFLTILNLMPEKQEGTGYDAEEGKFFVNGYRLFSAKVLDTQEQAVDVSEMILETLVFFFERGYYAFRTGNPSALLYTSEEIANLDVEYAVLVSALPLLESGSLSKLRQPHVKTIKDETDYTARLGVLIDKVTAASSAPGLHPRDKNALVVKLNKLIQVKIKLMSAQNNKTMRVCPIAICITGPSSVGKSNIVAALDKAICTENDFPYGARHRATLNENDNYDTDINADTVSLLIDDAMNSKKDTTVGNPLEVVIKNINNITRTAVKADLSDKGCVPVQPKIVMVTSNVTDLDACNFSNEPVSILRRFNFFVRATLRDSHKDEFGGFSAAAFKLDRDAWILDFQKVEIRPAKSNCAYTPYVWQNVKTDMSIMDAITFVRMESRDHFARQNAFVQQLEEEEERGFCPHGSIGLYCNECRNDALADHSKLGPQSGASLDYGLQREVLTTTFLKIVHDTSTFTKRNVHGFLRALFAFYVSLRLFFVYCPMRPARYWDLFMPNAYGKDMRSIAKNQISMYGRTLRSLQLPEIFSFSAIFSDIYARGALLAGFAAGAAFVGGVKAITKVYHQLQGDKLIGKDFSVTTIDTIDEEDDISEHKMSQAQNGPSPLGHDAMPDTWKRVVVPVREKIAGNQGITHDQLALKIGRHMHLIHNKDEGIYTNAFPLKGNFWLIPGHMFPSDDKEYGAYLSKTSSGDLGKKIHFVLDSTCWIRMEGTDFMIVRIVGAGDQPNLLRYVADSEYKRSGAMCTSVSLSSRYDTQFVDASINAFKSDVQTQIGAFAGYIYARGEDCYKGLCMSPLIPREKEPSILGFHLSGTNVVGQRHIGFAGFVARSEIEIELCNFPPAFNVLDAGVIPSSALGVNYGLDYPIHNRSPVNFMFDDTDSPPSCVVIGAHSGSRSTCKSCVSTLPISDSVMRHCGVPNNYGPPPFHRHRHHWHNDLHRMSHPCSNIRNSILLRALEDVKAKFFSVFQAEELEQLAPLSAEAVTSGLDGIRGIDRMDLNTSVGFPINKKKRNFATLTSGEHLDEGITELVTYDQKFYEMASEMEKTYLKGERAYPIFKGCMKDEATKIGKDKIRVFTGGQLSFNMLVRRYFLPITRMEHLLWKELEGCVGINAHGPEWSSLARKLQRFEGNNYIAGDYSKYDKKMSPQIIIAGLSIYKDLAERSGNYSQNDIRVMEGIISDVSSPLYEYDGVFVQLFSSWTSGVPITVDGNNIFNMLLLRYAYFDIQDELGIDLATSKPFDSRVSACVYGDDNVMQVHPDATFFTHTSVQKSLARIGMGYTMADKEAKSVPYIGFEDVSFLKRSIVWSDDVGEYVAPLEKDSIYKMMHNYLKNKNSDVSAEEISRDALSGALREMFRYGRADYAMFSSDVVNIKKDHKFLKMLEIPTYDQLVEEYHDKYHSTVVPDKVETYAFEEMQSGECLDYEWGRALEEKEDNCTPFVMQAGETEEAQHDQEETVKFTSLAPGVVHSEEDRIDPTRNVANTTELSLQDFFERPVNIFNYIWNVDVTNTVNFAPWELFFSNPRVINRMNNYRLLNCNLHVRFVINGGPFYSGRMLCSYAPFASTQVTRPYSRNPIMEDAIGESQRLHMWLNPTTNQGGDLKLPFFFPRDNFDINRGDWDIMGSITMRNVPQLRNTNGSTDPVHITVFAWASDVNLSVPTSFDSSSLSPQSGESDEYGKSIVSTMASTTAGIAGKLKTVPYIGRYAMATEMIANMTASVARMFGYSKPTIIDDSCNVVNRWLGFSAFGIGGANIGKLSLDPKQSLTIDPTTLGGKAKDEMHILTLATTESYLTSFPFQTSQAPETLLFSIALSPNMYDLGTGPTPEQPEWHMTPMMAAAMAFDYWRGSICVRLMVVSSTMQRGRLRVVWEPGDASPLDFPDYNVVMSEVMDISECQDKTFQIGWGNPSGYLEREDKFNLSALPFVVGGRTVSSRNFFNGNLNVYVVNSLTNPGATDTPVDINVFVKFADDVKFGAVTNTSFNEFSVFAPQSGRSVEFNEMQSGAGVEGISHTVTVDPLNSTEITYFSSMQHNEDIDKVYMGETVVSIRTLCKRLVHLRSEAFDPDGTGNAPAYYGLVKTVLIGWRGFDPTGEDTRDGSPYNYNNVTFAHWFLPMFAGWRGSTRFSLMVAGDTTANGAPMDGAFMGTRTTTDLTRGSNSLSMVTDVAQNAASFFEATGSGMELQPIQQSGVVNFEIPYQLPFRFSISRDFNQVEIDRVPGVAVQLVAARNDNKSKSLDFFFSTGEDFTMSFFSGVPVLFRYADTS